LRTHFPSACRRVATASIAALALFATAGAVSAAAPAARGPAPNSRAPATLNTFNPFDPVSYGVFGVSLATRIVVFVDDVIDHLNQGCRCRSGSPSYRPRLPLRIEPVPSVEPPIRRARAPREDPL